MNEIYVNQTKAITVPVGATKLTITHEWGDIVASSIAVSGTYNFIPNSIGVHTLQWYNNSNVLVQTDYYSVVMQLVSQSEFVADYAAYSDATLFTKFEKRVRKSVESYCSQQFGPLISKTRVVTGQGNNALDVGMRVVSMLSVIDFFGTDMTEWVRVDASGFYIVRKPISWGWQSSYSNGMYIDHEIKTDMTLDSNMTFRTDIDYAIEGSFGWLWIPTDVTEAAKLLIADEFNPAINDLRNHRIVEAQLGDYDYKIGSLDAGTGNTQADILLSSYVNINIGMV